MSRVGRSPVAVPQGVDIEVKGTNIRVKGPKGEMTHTFPPVVTIEMEDGQIVVKRQSDGSRWPNTY